jgi:hypothetical protein
MKKILVVVGLLGLATMANAAITVALDSTSPDASGTRFNYSVTYSSKDTFKPNDFFVVTDFAGLVDNSNTQPLGWAFSTSDLGPLPSCCGSPGIDTAGIKNLVWTYTGPQALTSSPINFSAVSIYSKIVDGGFTSGNTKVPSGTPQGSGGFVDVPGATIPEPATMGLMGGALLGLGLLARRRK